MPRCVIPPLRPCRVARRAATLAGPGVPAGTGTRSAAMSVVERGDGGTLGLLQVFSDNRLNWMHESIVQIGGVDMKRYTNLVFAGIEFTSETIDVEHNPNTANVTNVCLRR